MTSEFTVELWVKSNDLDQNSQTGLWYKGAYWREIALRTHNGILSWFYALDGTYYGTGSDEQLRYDEWDHVAMVMDGTELKMFQNGHLITSDNNGSGNVSWQVDNNTTSHYHSNSFGRLFEGWAWQYFNGKISQFKVSSNARYSNEFEPEYPLALDETTEALYDFVESFGNQVLDVSGNNYHADIYGATWSTDIPAVSVDFIGCTEPEACNYDETATADDGSCEAWSECTCTDADYNPIYGCFTNDEYFEPCQADNDIDNICDFDDNCPTVYNPEQADLDGDGTADACDGTLLVPSEYATIQAAIDAAFGGDSVLVSAGTYYENINFNGKNISVIGEDRETTIIDGNQNGTVVTFENGVDSTAVLTGFTIQNGLNEIASGIEIHSSHPMLIDLIIQDNIATNCCGGGIYIWYSNSIISNVIIRNNSGIQGGAVYFGWFGGYVSNVEITGNSGYTSSIVLTQSSFSMENVTMSDNSSNYVGFIIFMESSLILRNSIIWNNAVNDKIYFNENGESNSITITYSNIGGGEAEIEANDNGTVYWGDGNIDADPLFTDSENGDFTLQSTSPCIDAGDPESPLDPDGTIADMGALYFDQIENPIIYGCMDSEAINYNADATVDDGLCAYCDEGYTEIDGECYYQSNLDVLQMFIDNSQEGDNPPPFDLSPVELGEQFWEDGRLVELCSINNIGDPSGCPRDYVLSGEIPPEIGNLMNLSELRLHNNQLTGSIPSEIGYLENLTVLALGGNQLGGEIPVEIGNLTNLTYLALGGNQLGGEIPLEIGNLYNISVGLDLSHNQLTGEIPSVIWNLVYLNSLYLSNNQLTGEIPPEIGNLTNLGLLRLDNNELSGTIPSEIVELTSLDFLWLDNNQFSGLISEILCELDIDYENTNNWDIGGNQLCPPYPECLINQEPFTDENNNGIWDDGESFEDTNENDIYEEDYVGYQDTSECYDENCIDIHAGANLISFSTLPANGLDDFPDCIEALFGEGRAAKFSDDNWHGSLTELSCEDGYWLYNICDDSLCYEGMECSDSISYSLHTGANLISYPFSECGDIADVLPEYVQNCLDAIAGEGTAAMNTGAWKGSRTALCPSEGYWFYNTCEDIEFTYNEPTSLARQMELSPSPYPYNQSSKQAFYFIESIENIEIGNWILSFNGDKVIGAREWQGSTIDVPAMGDDGTDFTEGYMQAGDRPTFKLLKDGKLIDLDGDIPAFENNGLYMVTSLSENIELPSTFSLEMAYPNPFNPITTLSFALPTKSEVSLAVYNLKGRQIISLVSGNMEAGYHSVVWNADSYSSGVYFVKMVAGDYISTQKLMLVK